MAGNGQLAVDYSAANAVLHLEDQLHTCSRVKQRNRSRETASYPGF